MRKQSTTKHLLGSASVLALSAAAFLASSAAANAQAISQGIYAGGSTLASEAMRQIFDCYDGTTVGIAGTSGGDGFTFTSATGPGNLPLACATWSTVTSHQVQGMYAGVGSGNGFRGYISNDPSQWYGGTENPGASNTTIGTPFPAGQPPFVDSNNSTNFGVYPYPHVDIGFSDSPLANITTTVTTLTTSQVSFNPTQSWTTAGGSMTQITLNSTFTTNAAYNVTNYGPVIQVPAFEVGVGIAVNTNSSKLQINSKVSGGGAGSAIQLTEAQLCAIFSGLVTNWNDSTTMIPYLDSSGTPLQQLFDAANVGNGTGAEAYATASLPINLIYRSDGSGTSFIITNYLHSVCPLLDPPTTGHPNGSFGYTAIFGAANLPSTTFFNLISNITLAGTAAGGNLRPTTGPWNAVASTVTTSTVTSVGGAWLGENGSGGVAASISDAAAQGGFIGYVSADFTSPYSKPVSGAGLTNVDPPLSASLQDEFLRSQGVYVPSTTSTNGTNIFIAPTPAALDLAWSDSRLQTPANTWTYNDYNIYGNTFAKAFTTTTQVTQNGVTLSTQSVLPLAIVSGAYPLAGTTFMTFYTCYADAAGTPRVNAINNFISWYFNASDNNGDANVQAVVENAGFHLLPATYAGNILSEYSANDLGLIPISSNGDPNSINSVCVSASGAN